MALNTNIEQAKAEYAPYYRNSLLYLACVDLEQDMSQDERLLRAHDLALSAFLAETIYNFGELVRSVQLTLSPELRLSFRRRFVSLYSLCVANAPHP